MNRKRIVAALMGNGQIGLIEEDIPPVRQGTVLVEVHNSLVSPGSEVGGWRGLKKMNNQFPGDKPKPRGYSNAGIVLEVGAGVEKFKPGDRVACVGIGYALHTNFALVPHNLCFSLPDNVTFPQGSYALLAGTAIHALRRGDPQFGEYVAVVGLGLVGQLTSMFYQLAGNYVIGWDSIAFRVDIAKKWGIDATAVVGAEDEVASTRAFTNGYGLDTAVFAFGGDGNSAIEKIETCLKRSPDGHLMGRIVVVGNTSFTYPLTLTNVDIRRSSRPGPGYHDETWETGLDYPPVFMRWTTRTNLELCMRLISEGKLKVDSLTTHTIPMENVDAGISAIINEPDKILGVIFEMKY